MRFQGAFCKGYPLRILVSSASELFTDNQPHGEGLICYEIVSRLAARGHRLYVFTPQFNLEENLSNTHVECINDQAFAPSLNIWKYQMESRRAAQRLLSEKKVDLIHHMMPFYHETHFSLLNSAPLVIGPLFLPWQLSDGEIENSNLKEKPTKTAAKSILARVSQKMHHKTLIRAKRILITVDTMRNLLPSQVQTNSELVPFGVDTRQFVPSKKKRPQPTILFLANLLRRKGLQFLLQAMPMILENIPETQLIVVGGGPSDAYFEDLTEELGISSCVKFMGPVAHNKTVDWYQECDLYCLPSLGEPFGISLLEAMSCGKPVVTTRAGGVPDFIEDGQCGYLVPPRDSQALAAAIIKILTNRSLAEKMGAYNRDLCVKDYDWEIIVDKLEKVYKEVV